jgi:hypothetical protein
MPLVSYSSTHPKVIILFIQNILPHPFVSSNGVFAEKSRPWVQRNTENGKAICRLGTVQFLDSATIRIARSTSLSNSLAAAAAPDCL